MAKYGNLEVDVKIYQVTSDAKVNANGGVFQLLGNCRASVAVGDKMLFSMISGMIGISYRSQEDFANKKGDMVVQYNNSRESNNGKRYDSITPSDHMQAIFQVETMRAFSEDGFATPERDKNTAEAAGLDVDKFLELSKNAIDKAVNLTTELKTVETKTDASLEQLDKDLSAEVG